MKTVIFTKGGGRLGNQLIIFGHLLAYEKENEDTQLINLSIWPFCNLFKTYEQDFFRKSPLFLRVTYKFFKRLNLLNKRLIYKQYYRILHLYAFLNPGMQSLVSAQVESIITGLAGKKIHPLDLDDHSTNSLLTGKHTTVIASWQMRSWKLFFKHKEYIKEKLKFKSNYYAVSYKHINQLRDKYDLLYGVFIRQGDYKNFYDGKYYFTTKEYGILMKEILARHSDKKVGFLIASGDIQDEKHFKGLNYHFTTGYIGNKGHFIESLIQLSLCDRILSVPSTFSYWASFMSGICIDIIIDTKKIETIEPNINSIGNKYLEQVIR